LKLIIPVYYLLQRVCVCVCVCVRDILIRSEVSEPEIPE